MNPSEKKEYTSPAILLETDLETKAGSPLGLPNPIESLDLPDFEG